MKLFFKNIFCLIIVAVLFSGCGFFYLISAPFVNAKSHALSVKGCRKILQEFEKDSHYEKYHPDQIGGCYEMLGNAKEALRHYEAGLEGSGLDEDVAKQYHEHIGDIYYAIGNYKEAVVHYEQSIPPKYYYYEVYMKLGKAYAKSGNINAANEQIKFLRSRGIGKQANKIQDIINDKTQIKK